MTAAIIRGHRHAEGRAPSRPGGVVGGTRSVASWRWGDRGHDRARPSDSTGAPSCPFSGGFGVGATLLVVWLSFGFALAALAFETPAPRKVTPESGYLRHLELAPIAFLPVDNTVPYGVERGGTGRTCILGGATYFVAPLALRPGVEIESITLFARDRDEDGMALMSLLRRRVGKVELVARTPISRGTGEVEELRSEKIKYPRVERGYSYLLQVLLSGSDVCLYGARVTYRSRRSAFGP